MKNLTKLMIALVAVAALGIACKHQGFKKDKEGFYYKFHTLNKDEVQPQEGDIIEIIYTFRAKDSILVENAFQHVPINESAYPGDIFSAFSKMHLGDSATFILDGEAYFQHQFGDSFPFEHNDLYFDVKIMDIIPKEEQEKLYAEYLQQQEDMIEQNRIEEDILIKEYIEKNNIKVKPTASGLYFIKTVSGKGKMIKSGSNIKVHYTGKFLNGTVFDSSIEYGDPIDLVAGSNSVIPGWEEALLLMRGGDKATVIIPSSLAYGSGRQGIPPYTTLVFEMEIISVE